jgi:hypothetical protein
LPETGSYDFGITGEGQVLLAVVTKISVKSLPPHAEKVVVSIPNRHRLWNDLALLVEDYLVSIEDVVGDNKRHTLSR